MAGLRSHMNQMFSHAVPCTLVVAALWAQAKASSQVFLGSRSQHMSLQNNHGISDLLAELEHVVGRDQRLATERRVGRLEDALRPMFAAMPQDGAGRLGNASVRYLLHRLFVQRHGWFVNGLVNVGDSWNSSSPAQVFKDHVGDEVHDIFQDKLSSKGFTLHQVSVFAATLEALVHTDSVERLQGAYRLQNLTHDHDILSEEEAARIMKTYMMMYVLSLSGQEVTQEQFQEASESILTIYPTWPDTEAFANEVRNSVLSDVHESERNTWTSTLKVLETIGERYGRWQDKECHALKATLIQMEESGTGRVPLEKFYESAFMNLSWQFMESVPYLRQLGALDESDPARKSVIIPNYVYSPANCVASSKFYEVCCIDECEALIGALERRFEAPDVTPARILDEVSALPSNTMQAPRDLPVLLKARLEEIAVHHGGLVPLHGRLFAQWMHHAYPRECPYPHVSGTTKPISALAYLEEHGGEIEATHQEISDIINEAKSSQVDSSLVRVKEQELPWSLEEELFVYRPPVVHEAELGVLGQFRRGIVPAVAAFCMAFGLVRFNKQTSCGTDQKIFV